MDRPAALAVAGTVVRVSAAAVAGAVIATVAAAPLLDQASPVRPSIQVEVPPPSPPPPARAGVTPVSRHLDGTDLTHEGADAVPPVALAAYQRAATVIDRADPTCGLDWPLLAAIGRVESDHGRAGGGVLGDHARVRPALVGAPLPGTDTDDGLRDRDRDRDRPVGPLQLSPSTWSVVAVDGDGDGRRQPQDLDDAALAGAVLLCAGRADLTVPAERRRVLRERIGAEMVHDVLRVRRWYAVAPVGPAPVTAVPTPDLAPDVPGETPPPPVGPPPDPVVVAAPAPPTGPTGSGPGARIVPAPDPDSTVVAPYGPAWCEDVVLGPRRHRGPAGPPTCPAEGPRR